MFIGNTLSSATGMILAVDESVADLLQRPEREIVGHSYLEFTYQPDRFRNVIELGKMRADTTPQLIRKRYVRADSSPIWIDLQVSRFGKGLDEGRLVGSFHLPNVADHARSPRAMRDTVRRLLMMERLRSEELGAHMFGDAAWTLLLDIYLAEAECRIVDIPTLAERGALPAATVARWVKALQAENMIEVAGSHGTAFQLSPSGVQRLETLLVRMDKGLSGPDCYR